MVADLPEAIWSNLGLTYLAHTDIQTVWEERGIPLKPMEWTRHEDGSLSFERELPNGNPALEPRLLPRRRPSRLRCGSPTTPIRHSHGPARAELRDVKGGSGFSAADKRQQSDVNAVCCGSL